MHLSAAHLGGGGGGGRELPGICTTMFRNLPTQERHILKHGLDWICKTWICKRWINFVKYGFVKHGLDTVIFYMY